MLNTAEKNVEIITPFVIIEELWASDRENVHTLQETGSESGTLTLSRHERVQKQIRTEYLIEQGRKENHRANM